MPCALTPVQSPPDPRTVGLGKFYLLVLCDRARLGEAGLQTVPHGKKEAFYQHLFEHGAFPAADDMMPLEVGGGAPTEGVPVARNEEPDRHDNEEAQTMEELLAEMLEEAEIDSEDVVIGDAVPVALPGEAASSNAVFVAPLAPEVQPPDPDLPQPPVPEPPQVPAEIIRQRERREAVTWGHFRLRFKKASDREPHGRWEASCPWHAKSSVTKCKKTLRLPGPSVEEQEQTLQLLRHWCNSARAYSRQREHVSYTPTLQLLPSAAIIMAQQITDEPPVVVDTDEMLDGVRDAEAPPAPKAKAKGKGKARPKAKGKPKAQACKAKAKPGLAPVPAAGNVPASSSSSGSSSSTSTSSDSSSSSSV